MKQRQKHFFALSFLSYLLAPSSGESLNLQLAHKEPQSNKITPADIYIN